jgi:hypothetical protein
MRALLLVALLSASACVAPVIWDKTAREPTLYTYTGAHGLPRAYGGGVCPLNERHGHRIPPVPRAAFAIDDNGEITETRELYPYFGPHPRDGATCFREGWHLHIETPRPELRWDEGLAAWRADEGVVAATP